MRATTSPRTYALIAMAIIFTGGLFQGSRGVILPPLLADLQVSPAFGAAMVSSSGVGFLMVSSSFGLVTQRLGLKLTVMIGTVLAAVSLGLFLTLRVPPLLYLAGAAYGAGASMVEISTSLTISLLYDPRRQTSMLNLLHGFFGAGSLFATLWVGFWLGRGAPWQLPLALVGVLLTLGAILFITRPPIELPTAESGAGGYGRLFADPLVWVAVVAVIGVVGAESAVVIWTPTYLQQVKGLAETTSALYATLFFVGFTATRLGASWLVGRVGPIRMVVGLALIGLVGTAGLVLLPAAWAWLVILPGVGSATGFATLVALVTARHPGLANRIYSIMYSAVGITGISIGPIVGWAAERTSLSTAMWIPAVALLVAALAAGWFGWRSTAGTRSAISA